MPVLDQVFVTSEDIHLHNKKVKMTKNFSNNMLL